MASCINAAAAAARTNAMKSRVDLNDWRNSLHDIKTEEIFELIEKAIDIAASHYPKEFIQRRERLVKMLLNSQLKSFPDEITTTHTKEGKTSDDHDVHNNDTLYKHHHNICPANNEKSLNEDSQKPSSCSSMTENKFGYCAQDLKPDQNETNPDQHPQKANQETSKRKISDGDQQPVKRIRIKVIFSKSNNGHQNQENPAASVQESSEAPPQANLQENSKNTDEKLITRNPAAPVVNPSLASLDEASLQAKLENSTMKYQRQQQELKKKKIQFIAPLTVPPEQHSSKSKFKPPRKFGMIRH